MPLDLSRLSIVLTDGDLSLVPLTEDHREGLRSACSADRDIWQIYALSYDEQHFEAAFDGLLTNPRRLPLAVLWNGSVIGMTAWIDADPAHATAEIGSTYIMPSHRGTGVNGRMKRMLFAHGFALGLKRIQLTVDARNARSQAACLKIGAVREGVLRNHLITWTGHERDSAVFSVIAKDWQA